jgi:NADPH2:quinone reductase
MFLSVKCLSLSTKSCCVLTLRGIVKQYDIYYNNELIDNHLYSTSRNKMKALFIAKHGDSSVLRIQELPKPVPKNGEALVKIKFAGLNYIDIYMRSGNPVIPVQLPFVPGLEASGVVEALGEGESDVKVGDRVAFTGHPAAFAEYVAVPVSQLIPIPDEINDEQGAAFPLQGMTAQYLVEEICSIKPGDKVLVHAAAGGVGLLVTQWLKHKGAYVIGTVSTEQKAKIALEAGADRIINYKSQDFVDEVKKLTNGLGADYIIDGVGKDTLKGDLEATKTRGHICIFGLSSGAPEPIEPHQLQYKSLTLSGGNLMNYLTSREELLQRSGEVLKGVKGGWLKLNISSIFPLEDAQKAYQLLESRQSTGKIILKISQNGA